MCPSIYLFSGIISSSVPYDSQKHLVFVPCNDNEAYGNLEPKPVWATYMSMLRNVKDTKPAAHVTSRNISALKSIIAINVHSQVLATGNLSMFSVWNSK